MKICSRCGVEKPDEAFNKNRNQCRPCRSEINKAYYAENTDHIRARASMWYYNNKPRRIASNKVWTSENKDKLPVYRRRYRAKNPPDVREQKLRAKLGSAYDAFVAEVEASRVAYKRMYYEANRDDIILKVRLQKIARRGAPGVATLEQVRARVAFYGGVCAYCGDEYEHIDHVIPLSRGGSNWPANLRPACAFCNLSKHNKKPSEWSSPKARKQDVDSRAADAA